MPPEHVEGVEASIPKNQRPKSVSYSESNMSFFKCTLNPCNPFACLIGKKHLLQESTWAMFVEAEQAEQHDLLVYNKQVLFSI